MSIVINPTLPLVAAQGVTADVVLQPGSVISARVQQILGNDTVRIAIGGQSIDVQSQVPLQAGQTLQLAVSQTTDGIRLALVSQQGAASAGQGPANLTNAAATADFVTLAPDAARHSRHPPPPQRPRKFSSRHWRRSRFRSRPRPPRLNKQASRHCLPISASQPGLTACRRRSSRPWRKCWRSGQPGIAASLATTSSRHSRIPGLFLEASLASGSLSPSDRHARSEGRLDRIAPGAGDIAQRGAIDVTGGRNAAGCDAGGGHAASCHAGCGGRSRRKFRRRQARSKRQHPWWWRHRKVRRRPR